MVRDNNTSEKQLQIVETYERVISYLYPIIQNVPRKHGIAREEFLRTLFKQTELFITAGKSGQISYLYKADANLAMIRFWMRFLKNNAKAITPHQEQVAQSMISEVGKILGSWIRNKKVNRG